MKVGNRVKSILNRTLDDDMEQANCEKTGKGKKRNTQKPRHRHQRKVAVVEKKKAKGKRKKTEQKREIKYGKKTVVLDLSDIDRDGKDKNSPAMTFVEAEAWNKKSNHEKNDEGFYVLKDKVEKKKKEAKESLFFSKVRLKVRGRSVFMDDVNQLESFSAWLGNAALDFHMELVINELKSIGNGDLVEIWSCCFYNHTIIGFDGKLC